MEELAVINHRLGGHRITLQGLKALLKGRQIKEAIQITEIGCGGGDNLQIIKQWALKHHIPVMLTGIDINKDCIDFAMAQPGNVDIHFMCSDYRRAQLSLSMQIIFSSLFCHHFTNDELVEQLQWMHQNSRLGFFINDLHRHPLAYHSIKILTRLFSDSYLVKNDAPLSVKKGFTRREWDSLFQRAGIRDYSCRWMWAFRWLVVSKK